MRTHAEIIKAARFSEDERPGPHALARVLHATVGGDLDKLQKRVRAWLISDSVPGEYWSLLERAGVASIAELSEYATSRMFAKGKAESVSRANPSDAEAA